MTLRGVVFSAFAVLLLAAAPAVAQPGCGPGYGFLTPEQHLMHFADMQRATAGMSINDMWDYRYQQRQKIFAMSAAERDRFSADLAKRWNALSPAEQQKTRDQLAAWRADRPRGMGRGMGRGRGMGGGMGGGMGDCWY